MPAAALRPVWRRRGFYPGLCALAVAAGLLFPIAWMVSTALKRHSDVFVYPPVWIPAHLTFAAFGAALRGDMLGFLLNSLLIAACTALLSTATGALAAYPMSRRRTPATRIALGYLLASIAFPAPLLLISTYIVTAQMGLINTYELVILVNCVFTLPVCVWTLKSFFDGLPIEVEEAAMIDGAGPLKTFLRIVTPMSRPGLTAAAIYAFVTAWNDLTIGLTLTTSTDMRPLPAGISVTFLQEFQYQWPEMMAVATVATLPILGLFVAFQRNFIEGVTAGAVKQ
jgi:multiple sugar transport system permease protein